MTQQHPRAGWIRWVLGRAVHGVGGGLDWGMVYGAIWWVLGGLVLMPMFLGMPAFAPLTMPMMRSVAWGSLMGHVIYGLILGSAYAAMTREHAPFMSPRPVGA